MAGLRTFLDANILFSAALGSETFDLLWELARAGRVELVTSRHCRAEAQANLERKRPAALVQFQERLRDVADTPEPSNQELADARHWVPEKDAPVLAAAMASGARVLLTGDLRHFGGLMQLAEFPIHVRTVRALLLEDPGQG